MLGALLATAIALTAGLTDATRATAQPYNDGNPGVADVSVANGNVVIVRGDSGAQVAASVNALLVPGDYIATGYGSDAEVQFDGISMLRVAGNTQVRMVNLNPNAREVQLAIGTVDLAELQGADGSPQVDTPSLTLRPNQTGDYRVTVLGNQETLVTVRSGAATVATANGSQILTPGGTLVAYGSSITMQGAIGLDSFDQFNIARDQSVVSAYNSNPYLSPQLSGYANFANYGQWQDVPGYGYAWAPNNQNQTNFAPYQNGQWVWEPGYGYTWVDNAPYGYATSHYGTWFNNPNYGGWLWQPPAGQYQASSTSLASEWLPAVVSFFLTGNNGAGGGLGSIAGGLLSMLGTSSADIGWIPLAPGEQYQPWYGQNYSYPSPSVTNVTNVTNIYNYYSNARYYRGVTMIPVSAWREGNFRRLIIVRPQRLKQILLVRGAIPVVPSAANLHYSSVLVVKHPIVLSRTFAVSRFVAKAPAVTRFSFKTQQTRIESIANIRPKIVLLPPHPLKLAHPVYHPAAHGLVHLTVIKAVTRTPAPFAKPVHTVAPFAKPRHTPAPFVKALRTPAPFVKPVRTVAPFVKPMPTPTPHPKPRHTPTPFVKTLHTAAPLVKPVHTVAPFARPVHTPAPFVRPVHTPAPHVKPTAHPVNKHAPHPTPKPSPPPQG